MSTITKELFVCGRVCLFGEHSDWAGGHRSREHKEVHPGHALVMGTMEGLAATVTFTTSDDDMFSMEVVNSKVFGKQQVETQQLLESKASSSLLFQCDYNETLLLTAAQDLKNIFRFAAGSVLFMLRTYRSSFKHGHLYLRNHTTSLPVGKGLSSSAAVCVLIVRAFNRIHDLGLTIQEEMDAAYYGELLALSKCGRLDQCVAYGPSALTEMKFNGEQLTVRALSIRNDLIEPIYIVVADLNGIKNTKVILDTLQAAYPIPRNIQDKRFHEVLGIENTYIVSEALQVLSSTSTCVNTQVVYELGRLMTKSQVLFDQAVRPLCESELASPILHRVLKNETLQEYITGAKGVGSHGDGAIQMVAKSAEAVSHIQRVLNDELRLENTIVLCLQ